MQRKELISSTLDRLMSAGFAPEAPAIFLPYELAMVNSDLTVIDSHVEEIIDCLVAGRPTTWKPAVTKTGPIAKAPVSVTGTDYKDLWQKVQVTYAQKHWSDGGSMYPTDQARVDWILTGTDKKTTDIVGGTGYIPTTNGVLSYQLLATNVAISWGRPEYMPVMEATAMSIVKSGSTTPASSMSAWPVSMINGPIAREIRCSNGFGLWGPDPKHSNTVLKRIMWNIHQNVGNMVSGEGTIGQYGDLRPGLYFAENDTNLPTGWQAYHEEFYGRTKGTNSVTYGLCSGGFNTWVPRGEGQEDKPTELDDGLWRVAAVMQTMPASGTPGNSAGGTWMIPIPSFVLRFYASGATPAGVPYTKALMKSIIASRLRLSINNYLDVPAVKRAAAAATPPVDLNAIDPKTMYNRQTNATNIQIVGAGGDHTSAARVVSSWGPAGNVVILDAGASAPPPITVTSAATSIPFVFVAWKPKAWSDLLAAALKDLGPAAPITSTGCD